MKHVLNNGSLDVLRLTLVVATLVALFAFATADAAPPEGMGPLAVHPANSRYFVDANGRTVWLTGSHTWAYFQERGIDGRTPDCDYEEYLDFMQERGHNFLRLWTWEHAQWMSFADQDTPVRYTPLAYQRTGPGSALDGKPKFDLTKFNDDFFGRLRDRVEAAGERVEAAGERGIYVGVMFFQGFSVDKTRGNTKRGNAWHGHPFHPANNINNINGNPSGNDTGHDIHELKTAQVTRLQETCVRKMIDTLGDLENVLWEIGNECHRDSVAWQYHMIRFVKTYEATRSRQHPVGMTGAPINTGELLRSPADWISPRRDFWLTDPPVNEGEKVIVVDKDRAVRIIQSELLKEALDKVSVPADFQVLEGAAHGGKGFSTEKMNEMILAFFNRRLK